MAFQHAVLVAADGQTDASVLTPATVDQAIDVRARARRGLAIYFALVIVLTGAIDAVVIGLKDMGMDSLALLTMLVPALSSVIARLVLREGFGDVSFRIGGRRGWTAIGLAPVFPIVVCSIAYGIAWTTGLVQFVPQNWGDLATRVAVLIVPSIIFNSGEEIGWRGYMLTRLMDSGLPKPILLSGIFWGMWHVPLVVSGVWDAGPYPILSAALVVVMATAFSFLLARVRLATGSVWAAVAFHFAWNTIIQEGFDMATSGPGARLWVGESGILTAVVVIVAVVISTRGRWTILRRPTPSN
jgi:membrane protease YdiL (CAAX protease family)